MASGPLGQPEAACIRCGREFLEGGFFCYYCGGSRHGQSPETGLSSPPRPMGVTRLLSILFLAVVSTGLLSFGGCSILVSGDRYAGDMAGVGMVCLGFGLGTTWAMVAALR